MTVTIIVTTLVLLWQMHRSRSSQFIAVRVKRTRVTTPRRVI